MADLEKAADSASVPPTRFLVDILSGTSAGGINGIFLAKALANGQDMEELKNLWVTEGDIETLINDKRSIEKPLSLQDPPTSLLNSERMYLKLLQAFDGMDQSAPGRKETDDSPFVDELDLFVTSTDLQGVVLPIRLSDDLVYERRHRNVMRFVYSEQSVSGEKTRNDFFAAYNPFLAYAARCTSSFPFAFEPMCLSDTGPAAEQRFGDLTTMWTTPRVVVFGKGFIGTTWTRGEFGPCLLRNELSATAVISTTNLSPTPPKH